MKGFLIVLVAPLATLLIMVPSLFAAKVTHTSVPTTISKLIPGLLIRPHEVSQSAVGGRSAGTHPSGGAGRANPRPVPSP